MTAAIHLLVFDGFADWEPAFALTALRRWAKRDVRTVGFGTAAITTMGGLRVLPDVALRDLVLEEVALFMLPGGTMWEESYPRAELERLLHQMDERGTKIAAICGATAAVARAGLVAGRRHTSNGRAYLAAQAPGYAGSELYEDVLATRDRGLVTASGLGAVEFASEIFRELGVFSADHLALWHEMYRQGRAPAGV